MASTYAWERFWVYRGRNAKYRAARERKIKLRRRFMELLRVNMRVVGLAKEDVRTDGK